MTLADKQHSLTAKFSVIEDPHERLAAIVARGKRWPGPHEEEKTEANRVPGCVSRVWLKAEREGDRCRFKADAESPLVKGLVAFLCEIYDGERAEEIAVIEPEWIESLGLAKRLSPTRLNGLASVRAVIREFAAAGADVPRA